MTPRKIIGAVPAAFYAATSTYATTSGTSTNALSAATLNGITPGQFFRNDQQNSTSSASTFLNVLQTGAGKVAEFFGSASQSVLAILSNGNVGIGSSTPSTALVVSGTVTIGNLVSTTTTASTFAGGLSVSGATTLATSLTGFIQATSGVISATTSPSLNAMSGVLGVANGGTGQSTYTDGQLLIGNTLTNGLTPANLTGTSNEISVTNGHGSITLATPQAIGTGSSPTFASLSITGTTTTGGLSVASLSGLLWGTSGAVSAVSTSSLGLLGTGTAAATYVPYTGATAGLNLGSQTLTTTGQTSLGNASTTSFTSTGATYLATLGGNVGIGTTSPSNRLEVSGNTFLGGNLTATGTLKVSGIATLGGLNLASLGANILTALDSSGNLVGTSSPSVAFINATSTTATSTFAGGMSVAGTTGLTVLQNGSVGIGTNLLSGAKFKVTLTSSSISDNYTGQSKIASVSNITVSSGLQLGVCGSYSVTGQDGLTYGTVVGADGKCWLDRNLGATRVATSKTDTSGYGSLYQWGRLYDGHQVPTSGTTGTQSTGDVPGNSNFIIGYSDWRSTQNDNLWQGVSGVNNPCPTGFRLPTQPEFATLVTDAGITNDDTAYGSTLKLPLAGYRGYGGGGLYDQGVNGYYWSSSPASTNAYDLYFSSGGVTPASLDARAYGFSVRCLKD
jgi:uncharacterized protein (TIGR02145 family)